MTRITRKQRQLLQPADKLEELIDRHFADEVEIAEEIKDDSHAMLRLTALENRQVGCTKIIQQYRNLVFEFA